MTTQTTAEWDAMWESVFQLIRAAGFGVAVAAAVRLLTHRGTGAVTVPPT